MSKKNEKFEEKKIGTETEKDDRPQRSSRRRRRGGRNGNYNPKEATKGGNDLSWHWKDALLGTAATSIPWSWATGRRVKLGHAEGANTADKSYVMPGICTLHTVLTPGVGIDKTTAINIAAQALYTDVRRMLKSANAYEASDVVIYILAVGEIMARISFYTRLYATAMLYSYKNNYLPDALITAQGVDPTDLHNHPLEFLSRVNQAIAKASQIYIPKGFDFLERCRWEYANYYSEGTDIKDQIYMFTPGLFRKFRYDETADYAGALIPSIKYGGNLKTVDELVYDLNEAIDALVGDTDFANIAGDLMNRYGEGGVMNFSLIPQDAIINIVSGPAAFETLEQMQNARILLGIYSAYTHIDLNDESTHTIFKVGQNETTNSLVIDNNIVFSWVGGQATKDFLRYIDTTDSLLNVHENPSPEKTMLITRFQNMVSEYESVGTDAAYTVEAAADLVLCARFWRYTYIDDSQSYVLNYYQYNGTMDPTTLSNNIGNVIPFHYAPTLYLPNSANTALIDLIGAFDITAPFKVEWLKDINRVDMMMLFAVPDVGKLAGKK